jgi:hypothetical protein
MAQDVTVPIHRVLGGGTRTCGVVLLSASEGLIRMLHICAVVLQLLKYLYKIQGWAKFVNSQVVNLYVQPMYIFVASPG